MACIVTSAPNTLCSVSVAVRDDFDLVIAGLNAKEKPEAVRQRIGVVGHSSYLYSNLTAFTSTAIAMVPYMKFWSS